MVATARINLIAVLLYIAVAGLTIKAPAANVAEASFVNMPETPLQQKKANTDRLSLLPDNASQHDEKVGTPIIEKKSNSFRKHFTWGIDLGASIDLSGEDMSTFDAETYFGYKGTWIRTAALGAGIHKAFGNKYTFIPLYAMVRTSFRSKPSLFFFELKAGYSFNTLSDSGSFGGACGSFGLGINLAMSKTIQSHIILSYGYFTLRKATDLAIPYSGDNINSAVLRFGVNF